MSDDNVTVGEFLDAVEEAGVEFLARSDRGVSEPMRMTDIGQFHLLLLTALNRLMPRVVDSPTWLKRSVQ